MQKRAISSLVLALALGCQPGAFAQSGRAVITNIDTLFSSWNGYKVDPQFAQEAAGLIDYEAMARESLGAEWNKLSPVQRREFLTAFRTLIEQRYYSRWHREFAGGSLHYLSETPAPGGTLVKSILLVGKQKDSLTWHLDNAGGKLKVTDLQVNKKDLVSILKARFHLLLSKKGFNGLLAWINSHLDNKAPGPTS